MKPKLLLAIAAVALLPVSGIAADASDSPEAQLNKLLTEMNSARRRPNRRNRIRLQRK